MSTQPPSDSLPWQDKYSACEERYHKLSHEATHAIQHKLSEARISVHAISSRVKSRDSIEEKLRRTEQRNGLVSLSDAISQYHFGLKDIVGVRVVCMFLSQIEQIVELIRQTFDVIEEDRKSQDTDVASFGYMSDHLFCQLGSGFKGPRYDSLKEIAFELQIRTIAMDAWAAVSHHLDYKREFGVPAELKRDFHALSGLFYVADTHFEMFSKQVNTFREELDKIEVSDEKHPLNLNKDVIRTYLLRAFPDREEADTESVEEFLAELLDADYASMQDVDRDIQRGLPALEIGEREHPPYDHERGHETRFTSIGAARGALDMANPEFHYKRTGNDTDSYERFRKYVISK